MTSCEKDILRTFVENHGLAGTLDVLADLAKEMADEIKGSTDEKETLLWELAAGEIRNCTKKMRKGRKMKVWTITYHGAQNDNYFPIVIFSTLELAEAYVQKQCDPDSYSIDDFTVDKEPED